MKRNPVTRDEQKVIGVEARTSNAAEADPENGKIPALWQKFFEVQAKIPNKKNADTIIAAYTDYESDHTGEYSFIVSSEVGSLENVPEGMTGAVIPAARYLVFLAEGQMPVALIETWKHIWQYFSETSEYQRSYTTDFERHEKNNDSKVEVYIAIK